MSKHKNWKRKGTVIILQKNGKKYALDPKKPDQVFEAIELEEWERKSSNS